MSKFEEPMRENTSEWPYPVRYGYAKEVNTDVLILGGGIAGCFAAINVAEKGGRAVVVDKASEF
jgi:heterodisulfide reductase subunit A-like polyferredoxin